MRTQAIKAYVKEFRQTKYRANQRRSLLHFFKFLVLVIAFFIGQYFLLQAELGGLAYVAIGLVLAFFLVTTFLNHTGEHTERYPDEIWTYEQGVFNLVNLRAATDFIGTSHPHNQVVRGNFLKIHVLLLQIRLQANRRRVFCEQQAALQL